MEYVKAFKSLLHKAGNKAEFCSDVPYRRSVPLLAKADGEGLELGDRQALFVMTDAGPDREGDIILSAGVDVEQFRAYGSILWGHRADEPRFVLGRPAEVVKEETRILTRAEFFGADVNPDAELVWRMIQAGGTRAMSVGIMIQEYNEASDRPGFMPLNIVRSELVETSVTPVPMNPRAVALAIGETGSDDEAKAAVELFEAATDDSAQLAASVEATAMGEDAIKSLVKETVDLLLAKNTVYSVPSVDSAAEALSYFARMAAQ